MSDRRLISSLLAIAGLLTSLDAQARQLYQIGGAVGHPWAELGELSFVDVESVAGAIRPLETQLSRNLLLTIDERGGSVRNPLGINNYTYPVNWVDGEGLYMVDGDSTTAFVHPPRIDFFRGSGHFWGIPMVFDLGAPFSVERIRFFTRSDFPENTLRQYGLYLNDGSEASKTNRGDLIWTLFRRETDNLQRVVDLNVGPNQVQFIHFLPGSVIGTRNTRDGPGETFEIAEFEVYGQGFTPRSSFISEPIELGQPSSLGALRWAAQLSPEAGLVIQTRSGRTPVPEVFWRRTGVGDGVSRFGENGRLLTRSAYFAMGENARGGITQDLENWSVWHTYEFEEGLEGIQIRSPSPRQYLQIGIQFNSQGQAFGQIDSLFFEFSQPPVVSAVIGEVSPVTAETGVPVDFTYWIRAQLELGQGGFNALEIDTPAQVDGVTAVRVDGVPVDLVELPPLLDPDDPRKFTARFPRISQDQTLLEIDFTARVFRYGTPFVGVAVDTEIDEVGVVVIPGDAVSEILSERISVHTSLDGDILADVEVEPNPFSPNGDGVNDRVRLTFAVQRLTDAVPVRTEIYDLSGRRVAELEEGSGIRPLFAVDWDGTGFDGDVVAPGIYLYRIVVESDGGTKERLGHLAVAY
ncbi:MAG: gliding motility-associated C-terminal domain-containing protein [Candidatus Latescibacterota bacterium]|nr:gliding motility-associated C-terminal domain-containing protein [Candidatus Latescibacterota bacterium]